MAFWPTGRRVALHSLKVSQYVGCMLVPQLPVFLKRFVDDGF
jgi:hypothetical protein